MANKKQQANGPSTNEQSPEERFQELISVRDKEAEVARRLTSQQEQAQQKLSTARQALADRRQQVEQETKAEMEKARQAALAEAEAETQRIIAAGQAAAEAISQRAAQRQEELLAQLKKELLAG